MVRVDRPEIGDHTVDSGLVWVGFELLHVGSVELGVPVEWIHPWERRWKIHMGRDKTIHPRVVRDPGVVLTNRTPHRVVVPRILLEELGYGFDMGQRKYVPGQAPQNEDRPGPSRNIMIIFA